ncbi:MAG: hypothetical protein R3Y65_00740 [Bacillota bacterium]
MAVKFGDSERKIQEIFAVGKAFEYKDNKYKVKKVGKPVCTKGEPKTDIYILGVSSDGKELELKISFKQENADFLENKINAERAKQLLGDDWKQVLINSISSIRAKFEAKPLVYKKDKGKTKDGCITLGWKFEILNKSSGDLSGVMSLTDAQKIDVYAGTNLSVDKKNAKVGGDEIDNSGIATHILYEHDVTENIQSVVNSLVSIDKYATQHGDLYFACKALNCRTKADVRYKHDGNRPLAVYVLWTVKEGKLVGDIQYNDPLGKYGNEVKNLLVNSLKELNIVTTDDIDENNLLDCTKLYS